MCEWLINLRNTVNVWILDVLLPEAFKYKIIFSLVIEWYQLFNFGKNMSGIQMVTIFGWSSNQMVPTRWQLTIQLHYHYSYDWTIWSGIIAINCPGYWDIKELYLLLHHNQKVNSLQAGVVEGDKHCGGSCGGLNY